jgi:hypothetical protein
MLERDILKINIVETVGKRAIQNVCVGEAF